MSKMTQWDTLPLLPLKCIMQHLSTEDAMAAMSVSRHWRSTMQMYEGHRETLKLRVTQLQKNMFLTRIFRKNTRNLHIHIDNKDAELEKFLNFVFPQFFDTVKLHEVIFIGSNYIQQMYHGQVIQLKRIICETFLFKHIHSLKRVAFLGCEMDTARSQNDRYAHKNVEYYSRSLMFNTHPAPGDNVLCGDNVKLMVYSSIQHIMVNCDQMNTEALMTLSHLPKFFYLSLNIHNMRNNHHEPIDWHRVNKTYRRLDVAVNIVSLPHRKFSEVLHNVLVEGMPLTSLKVLFCNALYTPLLAHIVRLYQHTMRELVWVDQPYEAREVHRLMKPARQHSEAYNVNPFILLCWQCEHLRRLVIHGYWIWQYDLLGFVRLSKGLSQLEVSSIYKQQDRFGDHCGAVRVLCTDHHQDTDRHYIHEINQYTEFEWSPIPWSDLDPALKSRSTFENRSDYIVREVTQPLGVT